MSRQVECVRAMIERGHLMEAAVHVKRLDGVPLSEVEARSLLSLLATAILDAPARSRGDKFKGDSFAVAGLELAAHDEVHALCLNGMSQVEAFEVVGERRNKSAKTIESYYRKWKR